MRCQNLISLLKKNAQLLCVYIYIGVCGGGYEVEGYILAKTVAVRICHVQWLL